MIKTFIFTALPCEAKPFIAHFKLKKDTASHPFALYHNDNMALTVSGCGKTAMAGAVGYSLAWFKPSCAPVLINIGIAGHPTASRGALFAAHKITDGDTRKSYYPQCVAELPCPTAAIYTVSQAEIQYHEAVLYEMEASGFYEMACRFTSSELIQALKVVSDNQQASITEISSALVTEWLTTQVIPIAQTIEAMQALAQPLEVQLSPDYALLLEKYHFTVNAALQLKALLQRWQVLTDNAPLDFESAQLTHSKAVLNWLNTQIDSVTFVL